MNSNFKKAFEQLKAIGAPVIEGGWNGEEDTFRLSGEYNTDKRTWADYWNQYSTGHFGVDLEVTKILKENDLYAEWVNPGVVGVYSI